MACGECGANRKHMSGCSKSSDSGHISSKPAKKGAAVKRGDPVPRPSPTGVKTPCPPHNPNKIKYIQRQDAWAYKCSRCHKYLGEW